MKAGAQSHECKTIPAQSGIAGSARKTKAGGASIVIAGRQDSIVTVVPGEVGNLRITHDAGAGAHFAFDNWINIHSIEYKSDTEAKLEYTVSEDAKPGGVTLCVASAERSVRINSAVFISAAPEPKICLESITPPCGKQGQSSKVMLTFEDPVPSIPGLAIEGVEFEKIRRPKNEDLADLKRLEIDPETVVYAKIKISKDARIGRRDLSVYFCGGERRDFPCRFEVIGTDEKCEEESSVGHKPGKIERRTSPNSGHRKGRASHNAKKHNAKKH
jgi:hypothetical protein